MKKVLSLLIAFVLLFGVYTNASTLATPKDDGVHGTAHVYITTSDYTIINNRAYVYVGAIKRSLYNLFINTEERYYADGWKLNFNSNTKQLTIQNDMWISSIMSYTATFKPDDVYYSLSYMDEGAKSYKALLPPKIINGNYCLPASTLAELPNIHDMRFDNPSKTVNFTFCFGA